LKAQNGIFASLSSAWLASAISSKFS
jgi:hypothetical protein